MPLIDVWVNVGGCWGHEEVAILLLCEDFNYSSCHDICQVPTGPFCLDDGHIEAVGSKLGLSVPEVSGTVSLSLYSALKRSPDAILSLSPR